MISVKMLDHMGDDIAVVNAARVSFDKTSHYEWPGPKLSEKDEKLISYLAKHNHWSPFSHCFASFRVKAPIFVARQLQKHTVGLSWNEVSRRYVDSEPEFYTPETWRKKADNVKQGSSEEEIPLCTKWLKRDPFKAKFQNAKARAGRDGVEWSLELEDVSWPDSCPVLGLKLRYVNGTGKILPNSPSFDRINPEKGYVKHNVRIISHLANTMKSSADRETLTKFAKEILLEQYGFVFNEQEHGYQCLINDALKTYNHLIDDLGVAPEMARMVLPQSMLTEWIWSGSLYAFARVCNLRLDSHTQKETRDVAALIADYMEFNWPYSWKALVASG